MVFYIFFNLTFILIQKSSCSPPTAELRQIVARTWGIRTIRVREYESELGWVHLIHASFTREMFKTPRNTDFWRVEKQPVAPITHFNYYIYCLPGYSAVVSLD